MLAMVTWYMYVIQQHVLLSVCTVHTYVRMPLCVAFKAVSVAVSPSPAQQVVLGIRCLQRSHLSHQHSQTALLPTQLDWYQLHATVLTRMYVRIYTLACNSYVRMYVCTRIEYVCRTYTCMYKETSCECLVSVSLHLPGPHCSCFPRRSSD